MSNQMFDGKLRHFSGANQQDGFAFQCPEYFSSQFHRCKTDRYRSVTDAGLCANSLGHEECSVKQPIQDDSGCFYGGGCPIGILYLTKNLRFPDHHGIKTGSNPENVAYRFIAFMDVKGIFKLFKGDFIKIGKKSFGGRNCRRFVVCNEQHLNAVTGGKQNHLI